MTASVRILLIEDSEADAKLVSRQLKRSFLDLELRRVESEVELRAALAEGPWSVVISDWSLPGFDAPRALAIVQELAIDTPVIIVSGTVGEETAVEAMRSGARDYVLKDRLTRLGSAVARVIEDQRLRRLHRRTQEALVESEARARGLLTSNITAILIWDEARRRVVDANEAFFSTFGYIRGDLDESELHQNSVLHPPDDITRARILAEVAANGRCVPYEREMVHRDGHRMQVLVGISAFAEAQSQYMVFMVDITAQRQAERAAALQQQRLFALVERSRDAIVLVDAQGVVSYASPALAVMLGRPIPHWIGRNLRELLHASEMPRIEGLLARLIERPGATLHIECRSANGQFASRWLQLAATNLLADPSVEATILNVRDVTEEKLALDELRASETRYRRIIETTSQGVWIIDADAKTRFMNGQMARMLGYEIEEASGRSLQDFVPPEVDTHVGVDPSGRVAISSRPEAAVRRKDGTELWVRHESTPIFDAGGNYEGTLEMVTDLTDQKRTEDTLRRTEAQLQHAQKMEAVGRLAGGVAHDFNNLLSIILSYSQMAVHGLRPGDPLIEDIEEIRHAGERAAALTRQLLAFSRRQMLQPKVLNLGAVVTGMEHMMSRMIGEDVELKTVIGPVGEIFVDPGQIEQVIMNLVVNARDAMPKGGRLLIEVTSTHLEEAQVAELPGLRPGRHVMLVVTDTGTGMDAATKDRIFEPFFTTKELGKGTGLGLSTVQGIVAQSGGSISIESVVGVGTSFNLYFPRVNAQEGESVSQTLSLVSEIAPRGTETVLVVEDDPRVLAVVRTILRRQGYHVLEAPGGGDALLVVEQHGSAIQLLITDVVMPLMTGRQLADRITQLRPGMKVLYMSGYTEDSIVHLGVQDSAVHFLPKPFTPEGLSRKVREVLDLTLIARL